MTTPLTFAERILVLHRALAGGGIGHGFGGAVALAYHVAEPRATRDIDVNISVPVERAPTVLDLLPAGIDVPGRAADAVVADGQVRLWWDGPAGIPVDLFFPQHAFHREVARDTRPVPFLDDRIPVISATHLTVFKALFNRSRDWPDIDAMLQAGTVDAAAALGWVRLLLGPDSAPFLRLADAVARAALEPEDRPGSEMEEPRVDWGSLGGS